MFYAFITIAGHGQNDNFESFMLFLAAKHIVRLLNNNTAVELRGNLFCDDCIFIRFHTEYGEKRRKIVLSFYSHVQHVRKQNIKIS